SCMVSSEGISIRLRRAGRPDRFDFSGVCRPDDLTRVLCGDQNENPGCPWAGSTFAVQSVV
ncbi:MAG TPA: hypothetical protein VK137_20280, partial [Planctomycetaceae bacterium]|nr:hypothetical protein [Planctomycetaceae bacterium]